MPANYKITLFFISGTKGWSETYYAVQDSQLFAKALAEQLADKRQALCGKPTRIASIRINNDASPRASILYPRPVPSSDPYQSNSDLPDTSMMMRIYNIPDERSRPLYLRGNPDAVYDELNPANADRQSWLSAYLTFGSFLVGTGSGGSAIFLMKVRPKSTSGTKRLVVNMQTTTPSSNSIVTMDDASGIAAGSQLVLYNIRGLPFPPGSCKVVSVLPDGLALVVRYRTPADYVYPQGGWAVPLAPTFSALTNFTEVPRPTRRATGVPFDLSRGRRRSIAR